jgi:hypothetical protein
MEAVLWNTDKFYVRVREHEMLPWRRKRSCGQWLEGRAQCVKAVTCYASCRRLAFVRPRPPPQRAEPAPKEPCTHGN